MNIGVIIFFFRNGMYLIRGFCLCIHSRRMYLQARRYGFPKKCRPPWLGDENLGLLCPRRPYIELFCVEHKVKIIINNKWNIPFLTLKEQKTVTNCQLTFLKKLFTSNVEHKPHENIYVAGNKIFFLGVNVILFLPFPVCSNEGTIISKKKNLLLSF